MVQVQLAEKTLSSFLAEAGEFNDNIAESLTSFALLPLNP